MTSTKPLQPNQNQDDKEKYQKILNKYSNQIKSQNSIPEKPPKPTLPPIAPPQSPTQTNLPIEKNNTTVNIFKYLFYISILIFFSIVIILVYDYFKLNRLKSNKSTKLISPTAFQSKDTNTEAEQQQGCEVNNSLYAVGETFQAADGCNTCQCGPDFTISCTEKECN